MKPDEDPDHLTDWIPADEEIETYIGGLGKIKLEARKWLELTRSRYYFNKQIRAVIIEKKEDGKTYLRLLKL
jgi:hypothetical protein